MAKDIAVDVSRRARESGASERCPRVSRVASKQRFTSVTSSATWTPDSRRDESARRRWLESVGQPASACLSDLSWESAVLSCFREKVFYRRPVCRRARATGWRTDRYGETWGRIGRNGVRAHPPRAPPRAGSAARCSPGKSSQPPRPISLVSLFSFFAKTSLRRSTRPARVTLRPRGDPGDPSRRPRKAPPSHARDVDEPRSANERPLTERTVSSSSSSSSLGPIVCVCLNKKNSFADAFAGWASADTAARPTSPRRV